MIYTPMVIEAVFVILVINHWFNSLNLALQLETCLSQKKFDWVVRLTPRPVHRVHFHCLQLSPYN